ncbi:hypothetical protein [Urbifossiella limnaea]|uniref:Membrane-associated protein n=1 Tax=Urbifossiella limnaea TaxID=2528023 RepID=A0A517XRG1_9BACT|nr:hypothetical protein [Urbifossiella limnaea]QDU20095.1 hypothetical protein ETAA1_20380 [Urbifossiella limnaea]
MIPLPAKLAYTAFVAVLVPYYWHAYGPTNFLYYCDIALLMGLAAAWTNRSLLASAPAVGILVPQSVWIADFLATLAGFPLTGMTAYMFRDSLSLFTRGLSFFHFWLPLVLLWFIYRLGYDRRAFWAWATLAWVLMPVCYFLLPAPPPDPANPDVPVNVNYVYGMDDNQAQTLMPPLAWLALLMAGLPLLVYLPTHLLLKWLFRPPPTVVR